jgi:Tol biopolymer transport system component
MTVILRSCLLSLAVLAGTACQDRPAGDLAPHAVLTPDTLRAFAPDVAPDGRLAFSAVVEGKAAIWVAGADGAGATRRTFGVWDVASVWSPDGKWIAFYRDSSANIWVVPADSGDAVPLTDTPEPETLIGWLPGGGGVVFERRSRGTVATWVASVPDGRETRLLNVDVPHQGMPSPDGSRVAYFRSTGGQQTLWVWDRATDAHRQFTTEGFEGIVAQNLRHMWSPDGSSIAYVSGRTGSADVWVANAVTGELRQLTRHLASDVGPRWSPDGQWVAFTSTRGGQSDVWIIPAAGGQAVRVTDDPDNEGSVSWSADGTALTFQRAPTASHLWWVAVEGGEPRRLTSGRGQDAAPQVSPDGTRVLFTSDRGGNGDLWVVPLAGGEPQQLTDSPVNDGPGWWSPDGGTILFVSRRGGGRPNLYTMPATGGPATTLTDWPAGAHDPTWSPDGTHIAFHSGRDASREDLWVIPASGGAARRVTTLDGGLNGPPKWSPDGRYLFFTGTADPGPEAIYRVPVAGGDPVPLVHGDLSEPVVSPDGGQVIYSLFDAGYAHLHTIPAAGGAPRRLTVSDVAYDMLPHWSPDGSAVAFMQYDYPTSTEYIALIALEASAARTVVKDRALSLGAPTWTPDGKGIVYQAVDTRSQVVRVAVADLLERARAAQDGSAGAGQGG